MTSARNNSTRQSGHNLWQATASDTIPVECLSGKLHRDVVIVGGGIMGTTAALELGKAGVSCALLEASTIGAGASSRPGGFIVPHFTFGSPDAITSTYGDAGAWLVDAVGHSTHRVFDLIRTHQIECDAQEGGWYQPAHSDAALKNIEKIAREWQAQGFENELLDDTETARRTGVEGYKGSWYAAKGGTIHPLKYTLGLATTAIKFGVDIFQNTEVIRLKKKNGKFIVSSAQGEITAANVLICTNGLSKHLVPEQQKSMICLPVWQCATEPIPEDQRRHLFHNGECLSDTRANLFTYRFDRDWRLITGALEPLGVSSGDIGKSMAQRLHKFLRLESEPRIDYLWRGIASVTPSRLPEFTTRSDGLVSGSACNGRGIAMSTVFGTVMAEAIIAGDPTKLPYSLPRPDPSVLNMVVTQSLMGLYPWYAKFNDWLNK